MGILELAMSATVAPQSQCFRLCKSMDNPDPGAVKLVSFLGQCVGTFTLYSLGDETHIVS